MVKITVSSVVSVVLGCVLLGGCLTCQKEASQASEAPGTEETADGPHAFEREFVQKGQAVTLTAMTDRLGYTLSGPHNLRGTLTKERPDAPDWTLEGTFTFVTGGYRLGKVDVTMLKKLPPDVYVLIPVWPPAKGSMVTKALVEQGFSEKISASDDATFNLRVVEYEEN